MRGKPAFSRITRLLRPKYQILGVDIAGQVEAVAMDVTCSRPGDEAYANLLNHGYGGGFAEEQVGAGGRGVVEAGEPVVRGSGRGATAALTALQAYVTTEKSGLVVKVLINGAYSTIARTAGSSAATPSFWVTSTRLSV